MLLVTMRRNKQKKTNKQNNIKFKKAQGVVCGVCLCVCVCRGGGGGGDQKWTQMDHEQFNMLQIPW